MMKVAQPAPWVSPAWKEEYAFGEKVVFDDDAVPFINIRGRELKFQFSWKKLWKFAGPAWLMSLAYLDPGNLESNLQMGAYTRYELIWVLWWATFGGLILQEMSARIGLVTGKDLAQTVREAYPRWVSLAVYACMEVAVVGSDIQEVIGSGIALNLLSNGYIHIWVGCLITALDTFTFLAVGIFGVRYLEGFICACVFIMMICFFRIWWTIGLEDRDALLAGWAFPRVPAYGFQQAVATIGAVIMPHNLYLHSGLVLSRKVERASEQRVFNSIWYARIESAVALAVSFAINLAVVAVNASSSFFAAECAEAEDGPFACLSPLAFSLLNSNGPTEMVSAKQTEIPCTIPGVGGGRTGEAAEGAMHGVCGEIGLENAGLALASNGRESALYIWALGLLAAGQASTMVCTYAGQIIMSGILQIEFAPWKRVALTRCIAIGPSLVVALLASKQPGLLNTVNECVNVMQSLLLPFAMLPVLAFSASEARLGRFASSPALIAVSIVLAGIVMATNFVLAWRVVAGSDGDDQSGGINSPASLLAAAVLGCIAYCVVCFMLIKAELPALAQYTRQCLGGGARWLGTVLRNPRLLLGWRLQSATRHTQAPRHAPPRSRGATNEIANSGDTEGAYVPPKLKAQGT